MSVLTKEHIDFIIKDLHQRGIVVDGIQDEIMDHVCSAVEQEMLSGRKFGDAHAHVLKAFGNTAGLVQTQSRVIETRHSRPTLMFRSYFIIAIRNHMRQRFYSLINVTGLAVGIAACMIIALFVHHELTYDRQFENADRIFRVDQELKFGPNHFIIAQSPASLAELMKHDFPEVELTTRIDDWGPRYVSLPSGSESFKEHHVVWADSTFFEMFSVNVLEGDPKTALRDANTIAISRSAAQKYFPNQSALGQSLIFRDNWNHIVTAIYEDMPTKSHLRFEMLISTTGNESSSNASLLGGGDMTTYIRLREDADVNAIRARLDDFVDRHAGPQLAKVMGNDFSMEKFRSSGQKWEFSLMALPDVHLHSDKLGEFGANGNISYVYIFSAIGFFILCIACINFMNLSTARSTLRAKEVGVRKVMGSLRSHLIRQFLVESFVLCAVAIAIAVGLAALVLPYFNDLSQKQLALPWTQPSFYLLLLGGIVVIGGLAGLYPSAFLSAFKPVLALKSNGTALVKRSHIRSALVVFQFVISILLVISTMAVQRQLSFMQNRSLGFQKDQVIVIKETSSLGDKVRDFKNEVLQNSFINSGTISSYLPVEGYNRNNNTFWPDGMVMTGDNMKDLVSIQTWNIDEDYLKTLGMNLLAGRNFSSTLASDSNAIIINQSTAAKLGFIDPIGKRIHDFGESNPDGSPNLANINTWTIIGMVEDFHFESMKQAITPLAFFLHPSNSSVSFSFKATNTDEVIESIRTTWKKMAPDTQLQYSFLDDDFSKMYSSERRLAEIFGSFAMLAILIACLGLFGLTSFTAEQRAREIGIRKVLGASVNSIVVLLSKDFGKLVLVAFALSAPLAWYAVNWWIQSYEYRTVIGPGIYIGSGVIAFVIAVATMSYQSVKAATSDPAKTLRSE